jgi:anti-sigma regulatory factor (Ser/Thr protein kinase)
MATQVLEVSFRHAASPLAIGQTRHQVEDALSQADVDDHTVGDLTLLVSELVTNAVRHAETEGVEVRLQVRPDTLRLEVRDQGGGFEPLVAPSDDGAGGYGLFLVDRVADRWGVMRGRGSAVWLEVDRLH